MIQLNTVQMMTRCLTPSRTDQIIGHLPTALDGQQETYRSIQASPVGEPQLGDIRYVHI